MKAPGWLPRPSAFGRAAFLLYVTRAVLGWFVALPIVQAVQQSGVGLLERGDAALFQPGGLYLLELLREQSTGLRAGLRTTVFLGLTALVVLAVPQAVLFCRAPRTFEERERSSSPHVLALVPRFLGAGVLEAIGVALVAAAFVITSDAIVSSSISWTNERSRDLLTLALLLPGICAAALLTILADIVRLKLVRGQTRLLRAIPAALEDLRSALGPLFGGFMLASGCSALLIALVARGAERCRVEEPGALRVLVVLLLHQSALFTLVVIQALWVRRLDATVR